MMQFEKDIKPSPRNSLIIFSLFLLFSLLITVSQVQYRQTQAGRAATTGDCTVDATAVTIDSEEQKMLDTINTYRQQQGKGVLKLSPNLAKAATWLSNDMNAKNYANHTDSLGRTPDIRIKDCGYTDINVGENISQGFTDAANTFNGWKTSTQGHNENMLNTSWTVAGVSRTNNSWVVEFGATDDSGSTAAPSTPAQGGTVPSPVCAGSGIGSVCPTTSSGPVQVTSGVAPLNPSSSFPNPINASPSGQATPSIPVLSQNPDMSPAAVISGTTLPSGIPQPGQNNGSQGIIGILIALIMLILNFIKSLFGF